MTTARPIRIAVDIGGTFTDLEFVDSRTGEAHSFKTPTTPDDPAIGLVAAITGAARRHGFGIGDVGMLIHGTTIATNAVLTRDLPVGALITTAGFEDVLEIGRHARKDVYGLKPEPRTLLVPRRRRFGVTERIGAKGNVLTPLDMASVDAAIDAVAASGAQVVAVALINSYVNPAHERAIAERIAARLPDVACSVSHDVSPEIREFERTSTCVLNALLMPVVQRYVRGLQARTRETKLDCPLYLVQSNGGASSLQAAGEAPVKLLLSGPSGGVLAAEKVAATLGLRDVVAVDMGGTSYDISIIQGGTKAVVAQGEIDGLPVRVPMVEMRTIGAGGGSIVSLDASGRLQVGPRSAGARPGPVCYRRGGSEPTVTDVNVVLGRLDPARFLGGELALDVDGAAEALMSRVARPLGLARDAAAAGVLQVVVAKLAGAIKLSLFEKGLDPRAFALMSFGGAGGLHAVEVAEELGLGTVVFPREPSTFSAHGILQSDIVHDLARARIVPLDAAGATVLEPMTRELLAEGARLLDADRLPPAARTFSFSADLRYRGQAFELTLPIGEPGWDGARIAALRQHFDALHKQRFSFDDPKEAVELVTLRLAAIGWLGKIRTNAAPGGDASVHAARRRDVFVDGGWHALPVYEQASLAVAAAIDGPAVIEQPYTTMILTPGWRVTVAPSGDLVATRSARP